MRWDLLQGKLLSTRTSPGKVLAIKGEGNVVLIEESPYYTAQMLSLLQDKQIGPPIKSHQKIIALSPDGKTLATDAKLWDAVRGAALADTFKHESSVSVAAFSPDSKVIVTGSGSTAHIWDARTGKPLTFPLQHPVQEKDREELRSAAISPDGKLLVTGTGPRYSSDKEGSIQIWQVHNGKPIGPCSRLLQHVHVHAVTFSPNGKLFMTRSSDRESTKTALSPGCWCCNEDGEAYEPEASIQIWDTSTCKPVTPPIRHPDGVYAGACSPDGRTALIAYRNNTARLLELPNLKPIGPGLKHQGRITTAAFSRDGKLVLTGSADHTARLWEASTGKPLGPPMRHHRPLLVAAFSKDGKHLITGCDDGTAKQWDLPAPVPGDAERINIWTQVITKMEIDEGGAVRRLDAATLAKRRQRLEVLGGPPIP